jgi:hypothetical protein
VQFNARERDRLTERALPHRESASSTDFTWSMIPRPLR